MFQINNLHSTLGDWKRKSKIYPKQAEQRNKQGKGEINEAKKQERNRKTRENQWKQNWFFENINQIDKPLAWLRKKKREHSNYWYQAGTKGDYHYRLLRY